MNDMRKLIDKIEQLTEISDGPRWTDDDVSDFKNDLSPQIYKVFVNTHGDPEDSWATNAKEYYTVEEAEEAAEDLFMRWTAVKYWRVMNPEKTEVFAKGP